MSADSRDVVTKAAVTGRGAVFGEGGAVKSPPGGIYDFSNPGALVPAGDGRSAMDFSSAPSFVYNIEEDVPFRVRVIANDNATVPGNIKLSIESDLSGSASVPFPSVGVASGPLAVSNPDSPGSVIDGKAVMQATHNYSLEDQTDRIKIVVEDADGKRRELLIPVRTHPNDTDMRIISNDGRRGSD